MYVSKALFWLFQLILLVKLILLVTQQNITCFLEASAFYLDHILVGMKGQVMALQNNNNNNNNNNN